MNAKRSHDDREDLIRTKPTPEQAADSQAGRQILRQFLQAHGR